MKYLRSDMHIVGGLDCMTGSTAFGPQVLQAHHDMQQRQQPSLQQHVCVPTCEIEMMLGG